MLRTQIYLPKYDYKKLKERAQKEEKTLAQVVRELIKLGLERAEKAKLAKKNSKPQKTGADFLLEMAKEAERLGFEGSSDSSVTVDEVLYGLKK